MKLRWTIIGLILLTLLGLVAVISITLQSNLSPLFHDQEQELASITIGRVQQAIDERYNLLENTAAYLVHSGAALALLQSDSSAVIEFSPQNFSDLGMNLIALVNLDGEVVTAYSCDLVSVQEMPLPGEILVHLQAGDPLLATTTDQKAIRGLLRTESGPLLLVSAPVVRSDDRDTIQGTLLVGRFLDALELKRLSNLVRLPLVWMDYDEALTAKGFAEAAASLSAKRPNLYLPESKTEMSAFQLLSDLYGQPAYILRISLSRTVARNSQLVLNYLLITLAASVLLFGIITIISVDRLVLSPLQRLGKQVARIGHRGDLSERVAITSRDELGRLEADINQMLADLQQSQRSRQESEERFGRLVESMDDMVFTLDEGITQINFFGDKARKLGLPETISLPGSLEAVELPDRPLADYGIALSVSAENLRNHLDALQQALTGQHLSYEWSAQSDSQDFSFQSVLSPMTDDKGQMTGVVGVARDISEMKRLEKALRQRVSDLNALNEASRVFLSQLDANTILQESCRLLVQHFSVDAAWVGCQTEEEAVVRPQAAAGLELSKLPALTAKGRTLPLRHPAVVALQEKQPVVIRLDHPADAEIRDTLASVEHGFDELLALPVSADSLRAVLVVFSRLKKTFTSDTVQLFQAFTNLMAIALTNAGLFSRVRADQARLQSLSHRLVEIQEEERREIALELHDEIGQLLTGLKIKLDAADAVPAGHLPAHLEGARQLADDLIKKVRDLSLDLRPSMLDDLGLLPALLWHFDRFTSLTGVRVQFVQKGMEGQRFSTSLEITAYRVVQEGLTNVARHAGVSEATVRTMCDGKTLTIQIEDRGVGFSAGEVLDAGRSRGLLGMRERVAFVGGSLTIDSVHGWGTLLVVELPVDRPENGGSADDHDPAGG